MNTCETCKFWDRKHPWSEIPDHGHCMCEPMFDHKNLSGMYIATDDGGHEVFTGPKFGCVNHALKE